MYVKLNVEAISFNHSCSGKAVSITHPACVFVALDIKHAMRMRCFVICNLPGSTIFFPHYLINSKTFEKKNVA